MDEHDGRQIVGIDLHRRRSVIVRMTEAGERLDAVRIDNDPAALGLEIAKAGESPEVVLEATYGWYWATDVLAEAGCQGASGAPTGSEVACASADDQSPPVWELEFNLDAGAYCPETSCRTRVDATELAEKSPNRGLDQGGLANAVLGHDEGNAVIEL